MGNALGWIDEWEYLVERIVRKDGDPVWEEYLMEELDDRGKEGWELVTLDLKSETARVVFKRPTTEATKREPK